MRTKRLIVTAGFLVALVGGEFSCADTTPVPPPHAEQHRLKGEYIVTVADGGAETLLQQLYGEYAVETLKDLGKGRYLLRVGRDPGARIMEEKATESGRIKSVQPNFSYHTQE